MIVEQQVEPAESAESAESIATLDNANVSEMSTVTSATTASTSTSSLRSASLESMKEDFVDSYDSFKDSPLVLPSGVVFDEVVRNHVVMNLRRQASLHSFVLDSNDDWSELFFGENDVQALKSRLNELAVSNLQLPNW
ncbi:hypothetical protein BGZ46_004185 [Entomortierella lignicola]|nr:hypothetical protein BGZ46_004185 [Entomortierella lignicola]